MDPINNSENQDELLRGSDIDDPVSVDDFIRQLEEKEKDLHISSDFVVELEDEDESSLVLEPLFPTVEPPTPAKPAIKPVAKKENTTEIDKFNNSVSDTEIDDLNKKIRSMEADRHELLEDSQRRIKDFEAFRKRMERERIETFAKQICNLATQMLPVLDNLNRALDFAESSHLESRTEVQPFFDGIVMVNQQITEVFSGMGIEAISTVGQIFDPHLHEAVAIDENSDLPPHTITEELLRGYKVGEKVIRHSMVKVAKSGGTAGKQAMPENTQQAENILDAPAESFEITEAKTEISLTENVLEPPVESLEILETEEPDPIQLDEFEFEISSGYEIERFGEETSGNGER